MVEPEEPRSRAWWWTAVYAANLLFPLGVAYRFTADRTGGTVGLLAAVVVVWLVELAGCYLCPRAMKAATFGGMFVALIQLMPCLHLTAASVGFFAWVQATGNAPLESRGWRAELGVFAVTLVAGFLLVLVAWLLGGGPRLLFAPPEARTADEADYIDPEPGTDRPEPPRER